MRVAKPSGIHTAIVRGPDKIDAGFGERGEVRIEIARIAGEVLIRRELRGLTKIETTTRRALRRAERTSDKWPSCSAPMVGTSAIRSPRARHGRRRAAQGRNVSDEARTTGHGFASRVWALRRERTQIADCAGTASSINHEARSRQAVLTILNTGSGTSPRSRWLNAGRMRAAASAHVIVLGNEKGGSGKSTTAMHVAVALINVGQRVAAIDLDSRQKSFTHYIENRRHGRGERTRPRGRRSISASGAPTCGSTRTRRSSSPVWSRRRPRSSKATTSSWSTRPAHDNYLMRLAHSMADTLITPLNDSFCRLRRARQARSDDLRSHRWTRSLRQDGALARASPPQARRRSQWTGRGGNRLAMLGSRTRAGRPELSIWLSCRLRR